nr:SUMF1/EgtB/PvdO family nonheme iron enzyme [uncultured Carboxylicivirga sp.]
MKTPIRFILIVILFVASSSFAKNKKDQTNKQFKPISKELYAAQHELTNLEFRLFLKDLKKNNHTEDYEKYYPDTTLWQKKFPRAFNQPFVDNYFWHPGFNNYPVVNITKEAAEQYCQWLKTKYNDNPERKYKTVLFRLPTEDEWMKMAAALPGHNLPWYGNFAYEPQSTKFCANVKFEAKTNNNRKYDYVPDGASLTSSVASYKANKFELYDIIGNAAEITSDNIIKGGSWDNTIDESVINQSQSFQLPDPRVGCRIVMEIIER